MIVTQPWTHALPMMQQTVLLTAIRGPDGVEKYHPSKYLIRWYRRCILYGALDHNIFADPVDPRGGSFTGPSLKHFNSHIEYLAALESEPGVLRARWESSMGAVIEQYLQALDSLPHHFQLHFMHAAEIVGYKHPEYHIKGWWRRLYHTLVEDMHLSPETEHQLDFRLGDDEERWRSTSHKATQA